MSGFVHACAAAEVPRGGLRRVEINGEPVVIVRANGEFYAMSDVCSHDEVALSDGDLEGTTLECWLHGARFDVRTGRPMCPPATNYVPVYHVKLESDQVYVSTAQCSPSVATQESVR
jgi:3-phenylpropionate/trans-cinnamate dioxygenase ferredoxin component